MGRFEGRSKSKSMVGEVERYTRLARRAGGPRLPCSGFLWG